MTGPAGAERGLMDRLGKYLATHAPTTVEEPDLGRAAVAVVIAPDPPAILFIRRATRDGDPWSGQMALPGGKLDPDDADLRATAVRETFEEVAISLESAKFLGTLDDVAPRSSLLPPLMVRPYVFTLREAFPPVPSSHEVADAFWLPLADLLRPGAYGAIPIDIRGTPRVFPAYFLGNHVVWGLTERIVSTLLRGIRLIP